MRIILFLLLLPSCLSAHQLSDNSYKIFIDGGKKGLRNSTGKIVIPAKYDDLGWSNGTDDLPIDDVIGYKQNSQWGLITTSNKKLTLAEFSFLNKTQSQFIIAARTGRLSHSYFYGVLNSKGALVIPCKYVSIRSGEGNFVLSEKKGGEEKYGLINHNLEIVLPVEYLNIVRVSDRLLKLSLLNGQNRLYNVVNNQVVIDSITDVEPWGDYYKVYKGLKSGLITDGGKIIVPIKFKDFRRSGENFETLKYSTWEIFSANNQIIRKSVV